MSKDKSQKVVAKKGRVINRAHNRTIDTSVAKSDPKWEDIGYGIRELKGPGNKTAYIRLEGGKFRSVTRKVVEVTLAPKDAPNA